MSPVTGLTGTQYTALQTIAAGSSSRAAAETVGVHRNTVSNWLNLPAFQNALAQAKYQTLLTMKEDAEESAADAWIAIREVVADPIAPSGVRLKAALAILKMASAPLPEAPATFISFPEEKIENTQNPAQSCTTPTEDNTPDSAQSCTTADEKEPFSNPVPSISPRKVGRNESCPCGSGIKYKRCCLNKPAPSDQLATAA